MKKLTSLLIVLVVLFGFQVGAASEETNVVSLGYKFDKQSGKFVEGLAIIHYKNPHARPGGGSGGTNTSSCYGFLSKGARWKNVEPWVLNPVNPFNLTSNFLLENLTSNIQKWESAGSYNVLGDGSLTDATVNTNSTDGVNGVMFAPLSDANAIAVTYVWGIFGGPIGGRQLVEWDQIYNTNYGWANDGALDKMDFENISTHELGHAVGLADLYTSGCVAQTMYGYADYGQTNKRSLEVGDIAGISALY